MPHLQIQYSPNIEASHNMDELCAQLADAILALGYYPKGGLRVRAFAADHVHIADGDRRNAFVDLVFRIGEGRSDAQKQETGDAIVNAVEAYFADIKDDGYFMISLEIVEISKAYSWKKNSVHARLNKEQ